MSATPTVATPLIKWSALEQILLFSLVSGIGIVGLVSLGTYSLARTRDRAVSQAVRYVNTVTMALCAVATLSAIGWGLYLISHKG